MQGYGPITVTQGVVTQQQVDPNADRVLISNRSVYDVLVSFQTAQPLAETTCSTRWPVFVHAGDQIVYTLRKSDTTPTPLLLSLGSFWNGNVWILPIGRQSGLSINGTVSTSNQVFLLALAPGDETPTLAARPTNTDASSQARIITVPIAGGQLQSGNWNQATFSSVSFFNQVYSAPLANPVTLPIYLYYVHMYPEVSPINGAARCTVSYTALASDGVTVLGSGNILWFAVATLQNTTSNTLFVQPFVYAPPLPPVYLASIPANTKFVTLSLIYQLGLKLIVDWAAGAGVDPNNANAPGSTGNQTLLIGTGGPY